MNSSNAQRKLASCAFSSLLVCASIGCFATPEEGPKPQPIFEAPKNSEMEILNDAMENYDRGLLQISQEDWAKLRDGYPSGPYTTLAELKVADTHFYAGEYAEARTSYEEFIRLHPAHEAVPYVRFQIANCYFNQYGGKEKDQGPLRSALRAYEELVRDFPKNEYAAFARAQLKRGQDLQAMHEAFVAEFYLRQGNTKASAGRLKQMSEKYGSSAAAAELAPVLSSEIKENPEVSEPTLTELASLKMKKSTDAPSAPVFLSALSTKEAKHAHPKHKSAIAAAQQVVIAKEHPPFTGLRCEAGKRVDIHTAFLREPMKLNSMQRVAKGLFVVKLQGGQVLKTPLDKLTCSAGRSRVEVREVPSYSGRYEAQVSLPASMEATSFLLDRPQRLVVVVTPAFR